MQRRRSPRNIYRLPAVRRPVQNAAPVRVLEVNHTADGELTWTFEGAVSTLAMASNLRATNLTLGTPPATIFGDASGSRAPEIVTLENTNIQAGWTRIVCVYGSSIDSSVDGWLFATFDADETIFEGPQDRTPTVGRIDEP